AARWVPARWPILEAVAWPGLQLLHSTPPWPDANRLAHETIREQAGQGGTGRDREAAKLLLRHTTADPRLRGRKGSQRLRAQCPNRVWGWRLAALLGHVTANCPNESRRRSALPCPAGWWDPFRRSDNGPRTAAMRCFPMPA